MNLTGERRRLVVIGNRSGAVRQCGGFQQLRLTRVWGLAGSPLECEWKTLNHAAQFTLFAATDRSTVIEQIAGEDFDLLVSHGCPFVLPVATLRRPEQLFINLHPSPLPRLRGRHPANGALLRREPYAGATLHFMADRVDAGRIIHQQKFPLTPDIDLGLLYALLFDLEAEVFRRGMQALIDADFKLAGEEQTSETSVYTRDPHDMYVDFREMSDDEILTRIRAFGIVTQGVSGLVSGRRLRIFEAELIGNPYVLAKYSGQAPGTTLLTYENRRLVKSRDGIIKIRCAEENA
jgi:methionyl-tRNA formyltransferase